MGKHSKLSNIFHNMKARCYNLSNKNYRNYGARGITVCSEWLNSEKAHESNCTKGFIAFKQWALANGYAEDLTLDRIDVNGNYSPNNCRWVSRKVQQNNTRRNCFVSYKGRTQTLAQWCSELKLNYHKTVVRVNQLGWSPERAFETN
jgi:hypothetical protein